MKNIYGCTLEDLEQFFEANGSKKFHALQLFSWLYEKRIEKYSEITDIKKWFWRYPILLLIVIKKLLHKK